MFAYRTFNQNFKMKNITQQPLKQKWTVAKCNARLSFQLVIADSLRPSQQFFIHVGMGLSGFNNY